MSDKMKSIVRWSATGLLAIVFIGSAFGKITQDASALKMAEAFGLDAQTFMMLGIVEILSVVLFIIPRTGVLGTLLMAAYMGGAIATHVEHGQSILAPCAIQACLWILAVYRFPELGSRLFLSEQL